jgi:large subunit ribosomal protein L12
VNEENLKKVLTAAGVKVDETRVKALTAALEGVNIDEALKAAVSMPAAPPAAAPAAEKKEEKKKEEKKEEEKVSEEEAAAGLGALFG